MNSTALCQHNRNHVPGFWFSERLHAAGPDRQWVLEDDWWCPGGGVTKHPTSSKSRLLFATASDWDVLDMKSGHGCHGNGAQASATSLCSCQSVEIWGQNTSPLSLQSRTRCSDSSKRNCLFWTSRLRIQSILIKILIPASTQNHMSSIAGSNLWTSENTLGLMQETLVQRE